MLLENYVESWTEITDRGRLVKTNEEFYSFALKIEELARSFMTVDLLRKSQEEDMRKIFKVKLKTVLEVPAIWDSLSRKVPNKQLKDKLFKKIVEKWIDGRAYAYPRAFAKILKKKKKINSLTKKMKKVYSVEPFKKAEPAFRKIFT